MEFPAFFKTMIAGMLEQNHFHLPGVIQSQLTSWVQTNALDDFGLRTAIEAREITSRRLADGRNAVHVNADIILSRLDLARLAERMIEEKTGVPVTVRIRSLTLEDRSPAVSGAHLDADVAFRAEDVLKKL